MKFKIKAVKNRVWVYGDTESSVKNGVRFFQEITNVTQNVNILKTKENCADGSYMCEVLLQHMV